jgi:DNA polymerase III alpha subunit
MSARIRTGYSFRMAAGKIEDVLARIKAVGLSAAPITDTASTFGWVKWNKAAKKAGLKPHFGVELAVTNSLNDKKPAVDYWTFIARDSLVPLHELIAIATNQFRYQPMLTVEQACSRADVSVVMGTRTDFSSVAAAPHLFFGLGPSVVKGQLRRAIDGGHKLIAVSDNRYPEPGQQGFYETVCGRNASTQSYPQWIMGDEEWAMELRRRNDLVTPEIAAQALANRDEVLGASVAKLQMAEMVHPDRPATLEEMCREGARRLGCDITRPEYAARLDRELKLIADKQYEDYFYLVADICQWARDRMIVGPARGSSCGSLVCYLLRITTVDPIPYGLIFERFIDINRSDLPDIDIDFPEHRRHEVFEYAAAKYGRDKVARLGTVAMYQPRSALKEAAGAMDIPPWLLDPVMDSIIERSSGDSRALQATEDTLRDTEAGRDFLAKYPEILVATKMEGHPRHAGQHAAGIVITERPVHHYVAVDQRTGATMCDKKDAEELNLLKIDALGLTQLSIFEKALELAGLPRDHLFSIPLDDPAAFKVLNDKKYSGIFQFNGLALQSITDQVPVNSLNDIVAITALARPGPLNTGGTGHWIKVRTGREKETYAHPLFEPHLKSTLGVVAYQEQVMIIGREIGGLSWEDVTALRKAMSKSLGKEFFDQYGDRWKAGARAKGIPEEVLTKVWDDLCAYGSWAFNLSHALAYGLVSYYCCWLKAHYPLEFAAATLTYTDSPETQIKLLRELAAEGVSYLPADADYSTDTWTVKKGGNWNHLVGPLNNVLGIGPKMMATIMGARQRGEPLPDRARKLLESPRTKIDSLFPISDAFRRLLPDPKAANIISQPKALSTVQVDGTEQEVLVFCAVESIKPKDENEEINVAKRGGRRLTGPTLSLNLRLADDTDVIFAKVNRWDYERLGRPIVERGRAGKALYAIKGNVPKDFRMIAVKNVRYIGDMEDGK